jgi:Uma2 family endonuclease
MESNVSTHPKVRITPEEYLALERKAETKNEYLDGEMFPMPGVTMAHSTIVWNIGSELRRQLKGRPFQVHGPELRVKVPSTGLYTYPDVFVFRNDPLLEDSHRDTVLNPEVIFEVLSDSTESYDRGKKFMHYRGLDSLREYFLVNQNECRIERFVKQNDGNWLFSEVTSLEGSIEVGSTVCRLSVSAVYEQIEFEPEDLEAEQRKLTPPR